MDEAPRGHDPGGELIVHRVTEGHPVEGEHVAHQLLGRAHASVGKNLLGCKRRVQARVGAAARHADLLGQKHALAGNFLCEHPKFRAVHEGGEFHRAVRGGLDHRLRGAGQRGVKAPRPAPRVQAQAHRMNRDWCAIRYTGQIGVVDHDVHPSDGDDDGSGGRLHAARLVAGKAQVQRAGWVRQLDEAQVQCGGRVVAHRRVRRLRQRADAGRRTPGVLVMVNTGGVAVQRALAEALAGCGAAGNGLLVAAAHRRGEAHGLLIGAAHAHALLQCLLPVAGYSGQLAQGLLVAGAGGGALADGVLPAVHGSGELAQGALPGGGVCGGAALGILPARAVGGRCAAGVAP